MTDPTALAVRILMTSGEWIEMTVSGKDYGELIEVVEFPVTRGGCWAGLNLNTREVVFIRAAQVAAVISKKPPAYITPEHLIGGMYTWRCSGCKTIGEHPQPTEFFALLGGAFHACPKENHG